MSSENSATTITQGFFTGNKPPFQKKISNVNGKITKETLGNYGNLSYVEKELGTTDDINAVLKAFADIITEDKYVYAVCVPKPEFRGITTVTTGKANPPNNITRSKNYFELPEGAGVICLDLDGEEFGIVEKWNKLLEVMPEFRNIAALIVPSSSARITITGGSEPLKNSCHVYFVMQDRSQLLNLKDIIVRRCIANNLSKVKVDRAGNVKVQDFIDTSLFTESSIISDIEPIAGEGCSLFKNNHILIAGGIFDSKLPIFNKTEYDKLNKAWLDVKKADSLIIAEVARVKAETEKNLILSGKTRKEAKSIVKGYARNVLDKDLMIYFKDPELGKATVSQIIEKPDKYIGAEVADVFKTDNGKFRSIVIYADRSATDNTQVVKIFSKDDGGIFYELGIQCESEDEAESFVETINSVVDEINEAGFAKVMRGGKCEIMEKTTEVDLITGLEKEVYKFHNLREFLAFKSHETILVGKVSKPIFTLWKDHQKCNTYHSVTFKPYLHKQPKTIHGELNLYRGLSINPKDHGITYPHLNHLIKVMCESVVAHENWIYDWIAYGFQYPEFKAGVALVVRGSEGTGKSSLAGFLSSIWGSYAGTITQSSQVVGKFNSHLEFIKFLAVGEALFAGNKEQNGQLKALITDYELSVELKGHDVFASRNYINVMMTTNEAWVVPASATSRRYAVFDLNKIKGVNSLVCQDFSIINDDGEQIILGRTGEIPRFDEIPDSHIIQVNDFYAGLAHELQSNEVREQFYFDMLARDITGYQPNREIPKTKALNDQRLMTLRDDTVASWLLELFMDGETFTLKQIIERDGGNLIREYRSDDGIPITNLYEDYLNFCNRNKTSGFKQDSKISLSKRLLELGAIRGRSRCIDRIRLFSFDTDFLNNLFLTLGIERF
jgi:hypothetical protein